MNREVKPLVQSLNVLLRATLLKRSRVILVLWSVALSLKMQSNVLGRNHCQLLTGGLMNWKLSTTEQILIVNS